MRRRQRETEIAEYFSGRAPALRRTAYLIVRDWHTAEDMVQATFVKLYVHWPQVRRESVDAYTRRVLVNECLTHLRKHRREQLTDAPPEAVHMDETPDRTLAGTLAALPGSQRAIVALRFLDDLSVAEVASVLGVAEGTVKSQTSRALERLRAHLPASHGISEEKR